MDPQLRRDKQVIRQFIRTEYSDDVLIRTLDHARSGKMAWYSCDCLVGMVNAHTAHKRLRGEFNDLSLREWNRPSSKHYAMVANQAAYLVADEAYEGLGGPSSLDRLRRARLIPMLLAEIRRRRALTHANERTEEVPDASVSVG